MSTVTTATRTRELYIDLLKRSLRGMLHPSTAVVDDAAKGIIGKKGHRLLLEDGMRVVRERKPGDRVVLGLETMLSGAALDNLEECVTTVLEDGIEGDFIEAGIWRGGACILMRGMLEAFGDTERTVYAADSFEGLPRPDEKRYPADAGDKHYLREFLSVSLEEVEANFKRYRLLDSRVKFLKGWFRDTLPTVADRRWAIVRLDGDMYESTMDGLRNLYPGLSAGGFAIIDDYQSVPASAEAVLDYRREHGIDEELIKGPKAFAYWRKTHDV